jgi:hypothetical protein
LSSAYARVRPTIIEGDSTDLDFDPNAAAKSKSLVHHSVIIELNIKSYRVEEAKKNQLAESQAEGEGSRRRSVRSSVMSPANRRGTGNLG